MSVFKRGDIFHYDFWFEGRRYVGTTRQTVRSDATSCEQDVKRRIRRQAAGLEGPPPAEAPRFQDWAEVHFHERRQHMTRPEFLEDNLRVILRFWGARPKKDEHWDDPYHDLRLHDPFGARVDQRFRRGCAVAAPPTDTESLPVRAARFMRTA